MPQAIQTGTRVQRATQIEIPLPQTPEKYLYHGWQSWSLTAWVKAQRSLPTQRPHNLLPMQVDPQYAHEPRPHGSWYGAVELEDQQVVFLGSLSLDSHVFLDGQCLKGICECGEADWFSGMGEESELFDQYASLLKDRYGSGRTTVAPRVWCSWYSLYTEISEVRLLKILTDLEGFPFDVIQVDDGWQQGIGDWEANPKFPAGMDGLAARIRSSGRRAGLWLAPLLASQSSSLYKEHPEWLLHDPQGGLVSAGFNWGEALFALDTTHPAVLDWLAALMHKVRAWGYDYAKLDFLYAGALPGKRYNDMPREAAYRQGLEVIRRALGEAYFLTCGAPILPSLGLCDGMRIGPDVAGQWESSFERDVLQNHTIPGGRNAIRTSLHRLWLQPLLHTDPDVVYFRSQENNLSPERKALLQDLALVSGFKATSDIPAWMSEAEKADLKVFLVREPKIEKVGRYCYLIDGREVDFAEFIDLPAEASFLHNAWGALLDRLAGVPALMRWFDQNGRKALQRRIDSHPV